MTAIKLCGLSTEASIQAALDVGAEMIGFNFFEPSPRYVSPESAAKLAQIIRRLPANNTEIIALTVNMDDDGHSRIVDILNPDWIQLHGKETPDRVAQIKRKFDLPVMKAFGISTREDLAQIGDYRDVVDKFLFDAKPPKDSVLPGGNGAAFDWHLMENLELGKPIVLSGGLDKDNVAEAIHITRPAAVDVSSGIESRKGIKDLDKIRAFAAAVRNADAG